jgi:hypothetical protein
MNMTENPAARYAGPMPVGPALAGTFRPAQHGSWVAPGRPRPERRLRGPATTWLTANTSRCEALFASALQRSDAPTPDMVAQAIVQTARQFGARGCAGRMAQEFGDHPEAAAERMRWVRQLITQA